MAKPASVLRTILKGGADPDVSHDGMAKHDGSNRHAFWSTSADATVEASIAPANALAGLLETQLGRMRLSRANVLDLGCGAGLYGFTVALRHEGVNVTMLDQAHVIEKTKFWAKEFAVEERVKFVEGSVFEMAPPENAYDVIILSHFLQNFDYATNVRILKALAPALKPNGIVVVNEFLRTPGLYSPWHSALMPVQRNLLLLLSTEGGRTYTSEQVAALFQDAGLGVLGMDGDYPKLDNTFIYGARIPARKSEDQDPRDYHNQVK